MKRRLATPQDTDVFIICGGLGTRLRSVSPDTPKGMTDILGKPFIELLINQIKRFGFHRIILCTGYQSNAFQTHFSKQKNFGIILSEERKPLGTAGAVKNAERYMESEQVLVLNGDSLSTIDLSALLRSHLKHSGRATIAVVKNHDRKDVGGVQFDSKGIITQFSERSGQVSPYINAGIYVLEQNFLSLIKPNEKISFEEDIFPKVPKGDLYAFVSDECLYDIGTPERLESFKKIYTAGKLGLRN